MSPTPVACVDCGADLQLGPLPGLTPDSLVICPECGVETVVRRNPPLVLEAVPEAEVEPDDGDGASR